MVAAMSQRQPSHHTTSHICWSLRGHTAPDTSTHDERPPSTLLPQTLLQTVTLPRPLACLLAQPHAAWSTWGSITATTAVLITCYPKQTVLRQWSPSGSGSIPQASTTNQCSRMRRLHCSCADRCCRSGHSPPMDTTAQDRLCVHVVQLTRSIQSSHAASAAPLDCAATVCALAMWAYLSSTCGSTHTDSTAVRVWGAVH